MPVESIYLSKEMSVRLNDYTDKVGKNASQVVGGILREFFGGLKDKGGSQNAKPEKLV